MKTKKIFIFYYEWKSTKGNHAGMAYLVRAFKKKWPEQVILIKEPGYQSEHDRLYRLWFKYVWLFFTSLRIVFKIRERDEIFFTEYGGIGWQTRVSSIMSFVRPKISLTGIMHLPLSVLVEYYKSERKLIKVLNVLNTVIVFGSSLENHLASLNIKPNAVRTFHYVDSYYLNPQKKHSPEQGTLEVLFVGNLMRNYKLLLSIIEAINSDAFNFHVCSGINNLKEIFGTFKNVNTYSYLEEGELLRLMKKSDISLNIFDDTIGSNVITTSLACALPLITSDVGSIRDYADESCAIFCRNNTTSFIKALEYFRDHKYAIEAMSNNAVKKGRAYLLENSLRFFTDYFQLN